MCVQVLALGQAVLTCVVELGVLRIRMALPSCMTASAMMDFSSSAGRARRWARDGRASTTACAVDDGKEA